MPQPRHLDPQQQAHKTWLGFLQPVGLVVAPAAMQEAGWVATQSGSELLARQERFREALEPLAVLQAAVEAADDDDPDADSDPDSSARGLLSLRELLIEHLGWDADQLDGSETAIARYRRELPELGTTLAPTAVVPSVSGDGAQLLVQELPPGSPLDQRGGGGGSGGEQLWRATTQERFERLLRETGVEAGLLFNGLQLRLVVAPKGESSGHLTFGLADLATVSGRLMFSALDLLLGVSHVFLDPDGVRLTDVLKRSRSFQAVVSNALADQVLAALWQLLRGLQQADELHSRDGKSLLGDLAERDPQQLYGGLITVLMRLVFLLYAEDTALMPGDAVYEQNYKVSGLFERLQQDAADYPDTMEQRYGAWAALMSLCRLVYDGGGPSRDYLPARHGQLFDPAVYPWLETPWISDGVVQAVLANLLIVNGERISYRALDVEQIGSVYEGIMGYAVRRIPGRCIGLKSKPQGAKKQLTTAVDLDALLATPGNRRKAWLEEQAATTLPAQAATALRNASSEAELLAALKPRINHDLFDGPQPAGSLVFQPTEERRRSGSHYTPRSLTRPIVEEALRPWLERCEHQPSAEQILALKICDPAMGSGAFLVESCRYLAELLERAWNREGLPEALQPGGLAHGEEPLIYARRLVAQSCLYGVDKNPFAVNLARLSLWLVSLSKEAPFTFVDHALKCGDSLVGIERREILTALRGAARQRELWETEIRTLGQSQAPSLELFHNDSRSDEDDDIKRQALQQLEASTAYLRTVGDLLVAAFFNGSSKADRADKRKIYLAATVDCDSAEEIEQVMAEPLELLRKGANGIQPLHWDIAFPDVFDQEQPGFDAFVGNPPYLGGRLIARALGNTYTPAIKELLGLSKGSADLSVYFIARAAGQARQQGGIALVTTKAIKEGDTRPIFQEILEKHLLDIYYATSSRLWPGVAGTSYVSFAASKGVVCERKVLDGEAAEKITSALRQEDLEIEPQKLKQRYEASRGVTLLGDGFILSRDVESEILAQDPKSTEIIKEYIGAEDMLTIHTPNYPRACIDFVEMPEEQASQYAPAFKRCEELVKPVRDKITSQIHESCFWKHWDKRIDFFCGLREVGCGVVIPRVAKFMLIERHDKVLGKLYSDSVNVVACGSWCLCATLQSRIHEVWVDRFKSSRDARIIYNIKNCYRTFPLPAEHEYSAAYPENAEYGNNFSSAQDYYESRARLMEQNREGLTKTYNRFHDPEEADKGLMELRRLHGEMDQAVLEAYGWNDIPTTCGFGLDYLDTEEDTQLPEELQERIDSGELYFDNAEDACAFQAELRAYGAVKPNKKLPWRYRWPDAVRDEVLARLLALNAERYAEEVAQGLHE